MSARKIRFAKPEDAGRIAEIYAPYVEKTPVSFEYTPPDADEMRRRILDVTREYPWLILEEDGNVQGYAYAHRYGERAAFRWSCEWSIYLDEGFRGRGGGRALYEELGRLCTQMGCAAAYVLVAVPNPESIGFHERMGFSLVAVEKAVGYKLGAWRDLAILERRLRPLSAPPAVFRPIGSLD